MGRNPYQRRVYKEIWKELSLERIKMTYKTEENETLYTVALKFYPNDIVEGIFSINEKNRLYGNDLFLIDKLMDKPLGETELII